MKKFLTIAITTLALVAGCGDNQNEGTAVGSTTVNSSTTTDGGSTTGGSTTTTSPTGTDGMSGTGNIPTATDGGSTTGNTVDTTSPSTGEACPESVEGCSCGFNDFCEDSNNVCLNGTCTCPTAQHGCSCSPGGACATEGDACFEETKKCLDCTAVDNPYCPLDCQLASGSDLKEYPDDVGFPWSICFDYCPVVNGVPDPTNCPLPEGYTVEDIFCLPGQQNQFICTTKCVSNNDCPFTGHCMKWGAEFDFCAYDNPDQKEGAPLTLEAGYDFSINMCLCTAETCMQMY